MGSDDPILKEALVCPAGEVDKNSLREFYDEMYPGRRYADIWHWINRPSFYDGKVPIVIFYRGRVIAHAGMIPFHVLLSGKRYTASWFIDFAVLPEFQKRGLGALIAKRWMEFSDISVEIGHNEGSGTVFKKLGWKESRSGCLIHYFLKPFDYYKFKGVVPDRMRNVLNTLSSAILNAVYRRYAYPAHTLIFKDISSLAAGGLVDTSPASSATILPVRDQEYTEWRLLRSPDKGRYRIFTIDGEGNMNCIIKMNGDDAHKFIELLWISDSSRHSDIRRMVSSLAVWGMQNGYSYIRHYTSHKDLSDFLASSLKALVNNPGFMYYAKDSALSENLGKCRWHWQLIDNDFERLVT